jgi:hypothetical protein
MDQDDAGLRHGLAPFTESRVRRLTLAICSNGLSPVA